MTRFLAGLACGAMIVGAAWCGNRAGYERASAEAAAQTLASQLHVCDHDATPDRRDDAILAGRTNPEEDVAATDCTLATFPPKPCAGRSSLKSSSPDDEYRLGSQRTFRRDDAGGPWTDLPTPEISPTDRAKLVAELEASDRKNAERW
ncbi:MAG: hypothetical protein IT348_14720 [Candidatus Eisenbacteria bacterium]|nr:hypothetical protein [Candidatus Eisenbacteria bacterium]